MISIEDKIECGHDRWPVNNWNKKKIELKNKIRSINSMSQKTRFKFDEVHFCHRVIDQTEREPIHLLLLATSCWAREIWKRAAHCAALIKKWKTFESMEQHPERRFLAGDLNRSVSSSFLAREKEKRSKVDGPKRSAVSCPSLPYSGG